MRSCRATAYLGDRLGKHCSLATEHSMSAITTKDVRQIAELRSRLAVDKLDFEYEVSRQDRDLILGVLATQAGFVTPKEVMEAAAASLSGSDPRSLLTHLVEAGALTPARRQLPEALADEAAAAPPGNP